jgi:hypothetical protein
MSIKIKPRANVTQGFIEEYERLASEKLRGMMDKLSAYPERQRQAVMKKHAAMYGRLTAIIRGKSGPGVGMDFQLAQLRALDYEKLDVYTAPALRDTFLIGKTRELEMEEVGSRGNTPLRYWDVGAYTIFINTRLLLEENTSGIHVVPARAPTASQRHVHHYAIPDTERSQHPPTWQTRTCWSQFGAPVTMAVSELDIVELFRIMRIFAGRYYSGSPLVGIQDLPFMRRLS